MVCRPGALTGIKTCLCSFVLAVGPEWVNRYSWRPPLMKKRCIFIFFYGVLGALRYVTLRCVVLSYLFIYLFVYSFIKHQKFLPNPIERGQWTQLFKALHTSKGWCSKKQVHNSLEVKARQRRYESSDILTLFLSLKHIRNRNDWWV